METSTNIYEDDPVPGIDPKYHVYMYLEHDKRTMIDFGPFPCDVPVEGQLATSNSEYQVNIVYLNLKEMKLLRDKLSAAIDLLETSKPFR